MQNYYHPDTLEHIRNPLPAVAEWAMLTELEVPAYNPKESSCRFVDGGWVVEVNAPEPVLIPTSALMYQTRLALLNIGITNAAVEAIINAMPSPQKEQALILWEFSPVVERENGFVSMIAPALSLTEAAIDKLFMAAVTL